MTTREKENTTNSDPRGLIVEQLIERVESIRKCGNRKAQPCVTCDGQLRLLADELAALRDLPASRLVPQEDLPPDAAKALRDHAWELYDSGDLPASDRSEPIAGAVADRPYPIPLNEAQERSVKQWAEDDRLWTTQETVEFNLRVFARTILSVGDLPASEGQEEHGPKCYCNDCYSGRRVRGEE